jgi:hypothetical protein
VLVIGHHVLERDVARTAGVTHVELGHRVIG